MSAIISDCGKYRYRLAREIVPAGEGSCCFIMLNPSTADADKDDPTIRRCIRYARDLGYARLEVVNLFAYRATSPETLYALSRRDAIGPGNDLHMLDSCGPAKIVICAWGNHGRLHDRGAEVLLSLRRQGLRPMALKIGKLGHPGHPLYLKADAQPFAIP